jgi:hypothetical protein
MFFKDLEHLEKSITDSIVIFFKTILFFCNSEMQSTIITATHYLIFVIGIYIFYFVCKPKSIFKIIFLIFVCLALFAYIIFNKCVFSSAEYCIYEGKNYLQKIFDSRSEDSETEILLNKTITKSFLSAMILFLILSIVYDYRMF